MQHLRSSLPDGRRAYSAHSRRAQEGSAIIASTELINAYNFTDANMTTWINLLDGQGISLFIFRLNSFSEGLGTTSGGIATAKALILKANAAGIEVAIDLHTWCKGGSASWDAAFDDSVSAHESNRAKYIGYVRNVLTAFQGSNVAAFMVMNEPQHHTHPASASENQFILDVVAAAKESTDAPVSVRFMGSASPTTGDYAPAIDDACDFICRNMYWAGTTYFDPRTPNATAENAMLAALDEAHNSGKDFWLTEFGKSKSNLEAQRSYVAAVVGWAVYRGLDACFCWASQPSQTGEDYNIFSGWTPHAAFRELVSGEPPHPECAVDNDCLAKYGAPPQGKKWLCQAGTCVLGDVAPSACRAFIDANGTVGWDCTDGKAGNLGGCATSLTFSFDDVSGTLQVKVVGCEPVPVYYWNNSVNVSSGVVEGWHQDAEPVPPLPPQVWYLDIHHSGSGETDPPTGIGYEYAVDQSAVVTSFPAEGWVLDRWELDGEWAGATRQAAVVPQAAGSAHHLMCIFKETDGRCFIATACGTNNLSLDVLRSFRDRRMPKHLINLYYLLSPSLAALISTRARVKKAGKMFWEGVAKCL